MPVIGKCHHYHFPLGVFAGSALLFHHKPVRDSERSFRDGWSFEKRLSVYKYLPSGISTVLRKKMSFVFVYRSACTHAWRYLGSQHLVDCVACKGLAKPLL